MKNQSFLQFRVIIGQLFLFILLLPGSNSIFAQCSGTVWDSGGSSSNYPNNANTTITYTASAGNLQKITFTAFNTEAGFDLLKIYDGPNTSSPLIGTYSGNTIPPAATATGSTLTLKFTSDNAGTKAGWTATLSCVAPCSNTTSGGTIAGAQTSCVTFDPSNMTSTAVASGGSGTISYQWENSTNEIIWNPISGATLATYDPPSISVTTSYRRKSKTSTCTLWGANSNIIKKTIASPPTSVAGIDQTQCQNGAFLLVGNNPLSGQTSTWSVVSGPALTQQSLNNDSILYTIPAGNSATLQYAISNGGCAALDQVVITNNTVCSTTCTNAANINNDMENEGTATNFNLSFQSTPALLVAKTSLPLGYDELYGSSVPNTSSFYGAYYIKKTTTSGDPFSGSHMVYLAGTSFSFSGHRIVGNLECGRTYKLSAWVAAYTNGAAQLNSDFGVEISAGGTSVPTFNKVTQLRAPASTSWNDLNWQRYEVFITVPTNGYEYANFYFSTQNNASGIVIDDVCVSEVSTGSYAYANVDQFQCNSNIFNLNANTPPAGYTGTWSVVSGVANVASPNAPNSVATITSGNVATLRWTVTAGGCSSSDDINLSVVSQSIPTVNNVSICSGGTANLNVSNCTGSILWSNGSTNSTISVSPVATTIYTVTCTPIPSSNLIDNAGFENVSNLEFWNNVTGSSITTNVTNIRTGIKAAAIDGTSTWAGISKNISTIPGEYYTIKFWAKTSNTNAFGSVGFRHGNSDLSSFNKQTETRVISNVYQQYTLTAVTPLNFPNLEIFASINKGGILYIDDVEVTKINACSQSPSGTVTITSYPITISNPIVSSCIDQPLQDVALISTSISWTTAPAGGKIIVKHEDKNEIIDVSNGATSPQLIEFITVANGSTGNIITANWDVSPTCASNSNSFDKPTACSADKLNCNILYLCGLDKPYDGDPWDHGMINYLMTNNLGSLLPALTKADATGYGLYDVFDHDQPISINLDDYGLVIISPTTEGYFATELIQLLSGWKGSILNMNYNLIPELGYGSNNFTTSGISAYSNTLEELLNYDNPTGYGSPIFTAGDYYFDAEASLWTSATSKSNGTGGINFKFNPHSNPELSKTHGTRVFLGYHMNGIWGNPSNGGELPAPPSSYFYPTKHLTLKGKEILDLALISASGCVPEICGDDIDDDNDGLTQCQDPSCNELDNGEFDMGNTAWNLIVNSDNSAGWSIDNTKQITGFHSAKVIINTVSGGERNIQLVQEGKTIIAGKKYKVSFRAKGTPSRIMSVMLQLKDAPFTEYFFANINITNSSQTFLFDFIASNSASNNVDLIFNLANATGTVWIDQVEFKEDCAASTIICGSDCISNNLIVNGNFLTDINSWTASNGGLALGIGGSDPNFIELNNGELTGNHTVYQDVSIGSNKPYIFTGKVAKNATSDKARVYLEFYNGTSFISKTNNFIVTKNYDGTFENISPFNGITPIGTTKVRIVGWCNGTSIKLDELSLVTCISKPTVLSSIPANRCGSGTVTLVATPSAGTINWYDAATGGNLLGTGSSFITPSIATTTTFYAEAINLGCNSIERTSVIATIIDVPTITSTSPASRCGTGTLILGATASAGTISWYGSATGGSSLGTGNSFTTPSISATTTYYIEAALECAAPIRTAIIATIKVIPTITSTTPASRCGAGALTLGATASSGTINWYTTATGGVSLGSGNSFTTPSLSSTTNYYIDATNAGCTTLSRTLVVATINQIPSINILGASALCVGGTTTLSPGSGGTWTTSNVAIASVTNAGLVTALSPGLATFTFTNSSTTCTSNPSVPVTIHADPVMTTCIQNGILPSSSLIGESSSSIANRGNEGSARMVHPVVEGCTYNLEVKYGETFNIRDYFHIKDENIVGQIDWSQVYFTYTEVGANSPTSPLNWHLNDYNMGLPVTVTAADAAPGTGNTGNGQYRVFIYRLGQAMYDDHMEIRVQGGVSNINNSKCDVWVQGKLYRDINKDGNYTSGTDSPCPNVNVNFTFSNGSQNVTSNASGVVNAKGKPGMVSINPNISQLPAGTILKPEISLPILMSTSSSNLPSVAMLTALPTDIDLSLTTSVSNSTPAPGSTITVTVSVTNSGPSQATGVSINDFFQKGVFTNIGNITNGGSLVNNQVVWTNLTINAGQNINLTFTAQIPSSGVTNFRNNAQVTAAGKNDTDSTPNNYDSDLSLEDDEAYTLISTNCSIDTVCIGAVITLKATATGPGLTYQWESSSNGINNWAPIPGAILANYQAITTIAGTNYYRIQLGSTITGCGALTSGVMQVTVVSDPILTVVMPIVEICEGGTASLQAIPTGGYGIKNYQWQYNSGTDASPVWNNVQNGIPANSIYEGANSTTLSITGNIIIGQYKYRLLLDMTGTGCGTTQSTTIILKIENPEILSVSPASRCGIGAVSLAAMANKGSVNWYAVEIGGISLGTGNSFITQSLSETTTYYVDASSAGCSTSARTAVTATIELAPTITSTTPASRCGPGTITLLAAASEGTINWYANEVGGASIGIGNTFTTPAISENTTYYIDASNGCTTAARTPILAEVLSSPNSSIIGTQSICVGSTTTLSPTSDGTWVSSDISIATVTNAGIVTGISEGSAFFVFTSDEGCNSLPTSVVTVSSGLNANIENYGSLCLTTESTLTATPIGGSGPYSYYWAGPNTFTATSQSISVNQHGNYQVTITDAAGCIGTNSSLIYAQFIPTISSTQSSVCEGQSIILTANGTAATSYQWGNNAANSTEATIAVIPTFPSSTYTVTVTNNLNCTASVSSSIMVLQNPIAGITGLNSLCIGSVSTLAPAIGGIWISSNSNVATVSNTGIVTAISEGEAYFTYTNSTTGCSSNPTLPIIVKPNPEVSIIGSSSICVGSTSAVSPSSGGTWTSSNPSIASIDNNGTVTGLSGGSATFLFTSLVTGCNSIPTSPIIVDDNSGAIISGDNSLCLGESTTLTSSKNGGSWSSSNPSVGIISNTGKVTSIGVGTAVISYYTSSGGCDIASTFNITVYEIPSVAVTGPSSVCIESFTSIFPNNGGIWTSSNSSLATVTNGGLVTGVAPGTASFTFTNSISGCSSHPTSNITILPRPVVNISGPTSICSGSTTQLTSSEPGIWVSSNGAIASINNGGLVTGISEGKVAFIFISSISGCSSLTTDSITIYPKPSINLDYHGSQCLNNNSQLSAIPLDGSSAYSYSWTGPLSFSSSSQTISIVNYGLYNVTVTDANLCSNYTNAYIYESYNPLIVSLQSTICEGQSVDLTVNASNSSFLWSESANNSTTQTVTVYPSAPATLYTVTVTNNVGCSVVAEANITALSKPSINLTGASSICIGGTTTLSPTTGGIWSSNDPLVASISTDGIISGLSAGNATFTFTDSLTNCSSEESPIISIGSKPNVTITGPNIICLGGTTSLSPFAGGSWESLNPSVATITNGGLVTAVSTGTATFVFTINSSCVSDPSAPIIVTNKPTVQITGSDSICIGQTTTLSPSVGGIWLSNNPSIALVSSSGIVSAINAGISTFTFKETATNCISDPTQPITINSKPSASITGDSILCVNENTTLAGNYSGIWSSSNSSLASVDNDGNVMALSSGQVTFTLTNSLGCTSNPTKPVLINNNPYAVITGPTSICLGGTSNLSPVIGGSWISTNPSVASVNDQGQVNALSIGQATFKFTDTSSGCASNFTNPLIVYDKPSVSITGPNSICFGSTTTLSPSSGGYWASTNPTVALVSNSGIVTGLSIGSAKFIFTESGTGCVSEETSEITVQNKPSLDITGPSAICIGGTTNLTPTEGGSWISSNPSVATITNEGLVTGITQGIVSFTFQQTEGCLSNSSNPITVNGKPSINISGPSSICINAHTQLFPGSGGSWISGNTAIASVTHNGLVTGISQGNVKFVFTETSTGCKSDSSSILHINGSPFVILSGPSQLCIGNHTALSPSTGGIWVSSNPSIASVSNTGNVTANSEGDVNFHYTSLSTGCISSNPINITVNPRPIITLSTDHLCVGEIINLTSPEPGLWISKNPSIASINASGTVIGLNQGIARVAFTSSTTGCVSNNSNPIIVNGRPAVSIDGPDEICIGSNTNLYSGSFGVWTSLNPAVATVSNSGIVTGLSVGQTNFHFTEFSTGCTSNDEINIAVTSSISANIIGPSTICLGYMTQLSPSSGGIWTSSNPNIAEINNSGLVTGKAPGKVSFTFTEDVTACKASLPIDAIIVKSCVDPDFNVTLINTIVSGNIRTNDDVINTSIYGEFVQNLSKPEGSIYTLIVNSDGSYTFSGNKPGRYVFKVQICIPPSIIGCPGSDLVITVIDPQSTLQMPIANVDIITVSANDGMNSQTKIINTLINDKCHLENCSFDISSILWEKPASIGNGTILFNGKSEYLANLNMIGVDTLIYKVCLNDNNLTCTSAKQIVTVNSNSAINSIVAGDDFIIARRGEAVTLNLLENDDDPEGDLIFIGSQGSATNQIVVPQGKYFINNSGQLTFSPNGSFYGPFDIVYTICDNNTNQECASATAHILIIDDLRIKLRVYLEGALLDNGNQISSSGRPLMRDDLRRSPFNNKNEIPVKDPYKYPTNYIDLTSSYAHKITGQANYHFDQIQDSSKVFSVNGENAIVDWVFVEIRSKSNNKLVLSTRSGLLQRDGDIVDLDGLSNLSFSGLTLDSFYVAVRHRTHLGVMSMKVANGTPVDFTLPTTNVFDFGTSQNNGFDYSGLAMNSNLISGFNVMWAGDANGDGKIKFTNPSDDLNPMFFDVFIHPENEQGNANYNFTHGYYQGDFNMNGKAKFDNPNDDKNLLYGQMLFYQLNEQYLSNFNFFIEQIPK